MSKTILIVDDSASIRNMVAFTLNQSGYTVVEAVDGNDGLAKSIRAKFDLILMDINMPKMDGFELTKSIRANSNYKFTPILILTTESSPEQKAKGKAAGATGWLVKPFNPAKLIQTVTRVLGS